MVENKIYNSNYPFLLNNASAIKQEDPAIKLRVKVLQNDILSSQERDEIIDEISIGLKAEDCFIPGFVEEKIVGEVLSEKNNQWDLWLQSMLSVSAPCAARKSALVQLLEAQKTNIEGQIAKQSKILERLEFIDPRLAYLSRHSYKTAQKVKETAQTSAFWFRFAASALLAARFSQRDISHPRALMAMSEGAMPWLRYSSDALICAYAGCDSQVSLKQTILESGVGALLGSLGPKGALNIAIIPGGVGATHSILEDYFNDHSIDVTKAIIAGGMMAGGGIIFRALFWIGGKAIHVLNELRSGALSFHVLEPLQALIVLPVHLRVSKLQLPHGVELAFEHCPDRARLLDAITRLKEKHPELPTEISNLFNNHPTLSARYHLTKRVDQMVNKLAIYLEGVERGEVPYHKDIADFLLSLTPAIHKRVTENPSFYREITRVYGITDSPIPKDINPLEFFHHSSSTSEILFTDFDDINKLLKQINRPSVTASTIIRLKSMGGDRAKLKSLIRELNHYLRYYSGKTNSETYIARGLQEIRTYKERINNELTDFALTTLSQSPNPHQNFEAFIMRHQELRTQYTAEFRQKYPKWQAESVYQELSDIPVVLQVVTIRKKNLEIASVISEQISERSRWRENAGRVHPLPDMDSQGTRTRQISSKPYYRQ